jgi:hypothetical protein
MLRLLSNPFMFIALPSVAFGGTGSAPLIRVNPETAHLIQLLDDEQSD